MKKFQSKKGKLFQGLLGTITGLFIYSLISDKFTWPFSLLILIPISLMIWIYFNTYYVLQNNLLKYRSGFLNGEIDIAKINEIHPDKTLWYGLKPALAQKGIIIKYHKFDEIYIAPENNEKFIEELLKINPSILVNKL
ncbi:PH domain-containing protein [Shivajiella indica]|uniref:PH domain-containing protein n=1 Tax=Shivajiella indica TaxID=872115 RepID=A0ABW5B7Y3_9BACT